MKKNIFKKIISISFLTLFLFSFTIPFLTLAGTSLDTTTTPITSANWFYTTSVSDNFLAFKTEKECSDSRSAKILTGIQDGKTWKITKCIKLNVTPPIVNNTANLNKYGLVLEDLQTISASGTVDQWWLISEITGSSGKVLSCKTMGPYSETNCTNIENSEKSAGNKIYQSCQKLNTKPSQPSECSPNTVAPVNEKTDYYPLAPLPGIGETCTDDGTGKTICVKTTPENCKTVDGVETCSPGPGFANYLNAMINLFIGICAVLAMIMIIMGGIQYMTSELISSKEEGKKKVTQAILGLLLALGSYAILNTINPDLLDISLSKLPTATIMVTSEKEYKLSLTQATDTKFKKTSYYNIIKSKVGEKFPHCLLQAVIQRESAGIPNLVGHDENAPIVGIPARKTFIESGKFYSGKPFSGHSITDKFYNDDNKSKSSSSDPYSASNLNATYLGLDWRFSHSLGLFGITFFPTGSYNNYTKTVYVSGLSKNVGIKDILNNTNNADILYAIDLMNSTYDKCGKDVLQIYKAWATGKCLTSNAFALKESALRKSLYDQCVLQDK